MLKGTAGLGHFEGGEIEFPLGFSEVIITKTVIPVMC
jgi:hypothetical protein